MLHLDQTIGGAGCLRGDLTPGCAAALSAVLDALSAKAGPEDTRSFAQRRHDALEEACHRLISAKMVPGRDGQPVHLLAHIDLAALRALPGAAALEEDWKAARTGPPGPAGPQQTGGPDTTPDGTAPGGPPAGSGWSPARAAAGTGGWYPTGPEAEAMACDATIIPLVSGHPDWTALTHLATQFLTTTRTGRAGHQDGQLSPAARQRLQHTLLAMGTDLVSGPGGLAAYLRTRLLGHPCTGTSQPLDLGAPTPQIPPHLRRAVIHRDRCCGFPGCGQPPAHCQIHHLIPRSKGGPTALGNLTLLCRFHHLTVIHRWGWTLTCHPDGTTTATAPDGRTLHSHSPPTQAA